MKKSPDSDASPEIKSEEKTSHNYILWGGAAFVIIIAFLAWSWTGGEKTSNGDITTSPENKITGQASAVNASQAEKPSTICEFCRQTNDTVYKNSGACKPCFS